MKETLPIKVEKITGLFDEHHICAVFSKRIATSGDSVGTLVACILAKDGSFADLQTLLHSLFEIYANKLEGVNTGIGNTMKDSFVDAKQFATDNKIDANYAICFFYQNACFVVRNGNKVKVWTFQEGKDQELAFEYGSGPYSAGQLFALGTEKFFSTFDTSGLVDDENLDLEEVIDGLATEISSDNAQSEIGVAFVKIGKGAKDGASGKEENIAEAEPESPKADEEVSEVETTGYDKTSSEVFAKDVPVATVKKQSLVANLLGKIAKINFKFLLARKSLVIVAVLILAILAISAFWSINSQRQAAKLREFTKDLENAKSSLSEAEGIISLNSEKARTKLTDANNNVNLALSLFPKDAEANKLKDEISSKLKDTANVAGLPFKEVVNVGEGLVLTSQTSQGLVGISRNKIFQISKDGKVAKSVQGVSGTQGGFVWDKSAFVFTAGKVAKIDLTNEKEEDVASVNGAHDLAVFLGNVYVLGNDQITKFVPVEKGYSDGSSYLEQKENFGDSSRFAIDGMVWVTNGNQILKYNRGKKEDFSIHGLVQTDVRFGEIYTNSDIENIYVEDIQNGALLVVNKDGTYKKAYQANEFKNNPPIFVDEGAGKIYIASGSKILEAGL